MDTTEYDREREQYLRGPMPVRIARVRQAGINRRNAAEARRRLAACRRP
jgi:hypothetical protein